MNIEKLLTLKEKGVVCLHPVEALLIYQDKLKKYGKNKPNVLNPISSFHSWIYEQLVNHSTMDRSGNFNNEETADKSGKQLNYNMI